MSKTTIEQTLKLIPSLFEINLNTDKSGMLIFEKLSQSLAKLSAKNALSNIVLYFVCK